jgi:hypothetical protein
MGCIMKLLPGLTGLVMLASTAFCADKHILMIAGKPSHGPGQHEHNAGTQLLAKWVNTVPGIRATTSLSGAWPDEKAFQSANAIFLFCDGGDGHLAFQDDHAAAIEKAAARGAGLMFIHYAVEPPAKRGHREALEWLGGFFELNYSVNPVWEPRFDKFPTHPITRGVKPFQLRDEWYYNMRFAENRSNVTGILVATPPAETIRQDGIRSGNPDVRSKIGQPHLLSWATERKGGGRSVGFTGGHFHANLGDENFRKLLLNSLLWVAKAEVPAAGVNPPFAPSELTENLDPKPPRSAPAGTRKQ